MSTSSLNGTASSLDSSANAADLRSGQSAGQFAASLVTSIVIFSVQVIAFLLIKDRFARIYQPRTYLVPERERTKAVATGWFKWIKPVLATSNSEFVQKCGLDAYFFLRYLRTLLKIFVPAAIVILPILLPLNAVGGKNEWALPNSIYFDRANVTGLDQLSWGNVRPNHTSRYWAHWILALLLVVYFCYICFDELRNYIRMRQAYMTSPQHRLRASATTVLVSSIPEKWLSVEALDGLYDVFPGGLRNIWINRNFDELADKVKRRDDLARKLESAETDLIKKCFKKHEEDISKKQKEEGKKATKQEKLQQQAVMNEKGRRTAQSGGLDSGNPHQVKHTIQEALGDEDHDSEIGGHQVEEQLKSDGGRILPVPVLGEGLHAIGHSLNQVSRGFMDGFRGVNKGVQNKLDTTNGFVPEHGPHSHDAGRHHHPERGADGILRTLHGSEPQTSYADTSNPKSPVHDATPRSTGGFSTQTHESAAVADNDQELLREQTRVSQSESDIPKRSDDEKPPSAWQKTKRALHLGGDEKAPVDYGASFNEEFETDGEDAIWRKYLKEKDRDTMRLPIFGWQWMFSIPLIGQKVDTIYYCRKEVARLNVEIEDDQAHPERFPFMNSAFIQFNHQVAAHMACQTVSHHIPKQMAPRIVEIDPNDVIWDNMSIPWWQIYIRTTAVVAIVIAMIVLWAVPVAATSALSQLSVAAESTRGLRWILNLPKVVIAILQGVLSPALLALLMFLLPVVLRFLATVQGMQSGMLVELSVQKYYFFFLFVQIFLVVTIANGFITFITSLRTVNGFANGVANIPNMLGTNIPKASNYFFSYMLLQALSVSAGALVQIGGLVSWFVLAPIFDKTARAKFMRQTQLSDIQWGTFFPVYTNLACIGLVYSVVSPLILIFNIITFALFWFVYRYQTLYITKFTRDTGGLLYPNAINLTFVGVYVMEVALIGLFFLVRDVENNVACKGQATGMIVILILTAVYQILLNEAFAPLFRYLPITLEDDAVRRDEEFARAMRIRHSEHRNLIENEMEDRDIEDQLEDQEHASLEQDREAQVFELKQIEAQKEQQERAKRVIEQADYSNVELQNPEVILSLDAESKGYRIMRQTAQKAAGATHKTADVTLHKLPSRLTSVRHPKSSWAHRDNVHNRRSSYFGGTNNQSLDARRAAEPTSIAADAEQTDAEQSRSQSPPRHVLEKINNFNPISGDAKDLEAQQAARDQLADALFAGVNDELEDLSQDQRDALVQRAFQHSALRARRPVIWIPRDELGVSDDEVVQMGKLSKNLWVSNVRQGLDAKGRCVYSGMPPDFSEVDVIRL